MGKPYLPGQNLPVGCPHFFMDPLDLNPVPGRSKTPRAPIPRSENLLLDRQGLWAV